MQKYLLLFLIIPFITPVAFSQAPQNWPKSINSNGTVIKVYQPIIESYSGNMVVARGAFSVLLKGASDPVFGALWINATLQTNRPQRTAVIEKIKVNNVKFA